MKSSRWIASLAWSALLCACNLASQTTPLAQSSAAPLQPATATLPPRLPTLTPTLEKIVARAKDKPVNCRIGPGTAYTIINVLNERQSARAAGRTADGTWINVYDPGNPNGFCWVSTEWVDLDGNPDSLPVVSLPVPSVTKIVVTAEPQQISAACDKFPQVVYLTAQITTDAPTLVTYRWEASTGVVSADSSVAFEEAGERMIREYYRIPAPNDYWIRLHILAPNERSEQVNFRATCNP